MEKNMDMELITSSQKVQNMSALMFTTFVRDKVQFITELVKSHIKVA